MRNGSRDFVDAEAAPGAELEHANRVLRALRKISRLITRTRNPGELLQSACEILVEERGYYNAWVILNESGESPATQWYHAGLGTLCEPFTHMVQSNNLPPCYVLAYADKRKAQLIGNPSQQCLHCKLSKHYVDHSALACTLCSEDQCFGVLCASIPREFSDDPEERELFEEIAADLGHALHGCERDLEMQKTVDMLRESELRFEMLFNRAPVAYQSLDEEGTLVQVNQTWLDALGYEADEVMGRPFSDFLTETGKAKFPDRWLRFHSLGRVQDVEHEMVKKDGTTLIASFDGAIAYGPRGEFLQTHCIFQDVTHRKNAERALRESEELYRSLVSSMAEGVMVQDMNRVVLACNAKAETLVRLPQEKIIGTTFCDLGFDVIDENGAPLAIENLPSQITKRTGQPVQKYVLGMRFAVNDTQWVRINSSLLHPQTPATSPVVLTFHDITEQRMLEGQLRQAEKLEAIGQLAGGVAHDFNNQLAGILGYANMLAHRIEDEKLRHYAENIAICANRSADLTRQLLTFARKAEARHLYVNVHEIIDEVCEMLSHSIDKRIQIEQRLKADASGVAGDPGQIQNMLLNLGLNARDAMPEGGTLTYQTELIESGDSPALRIRVQDTGCGMDAAVRERIFEPFFTTKEKGKGTGMGLAAVYGTVQSHRGSITVESEVGRGTTFLLDLPLATDPCESLTSGIADTQRSGPATLMLIDDEKMMREMMIEMLCGAKYNVRVFESGSRAIEHFRRNHQSIDVVLLDMMMPEISGRDVFDRLQEIDPDVRVLIVSGFSVSKDVRYMLDHGAKGMIQKPFRQEQILSHLAQILA